MGTRNILLSIKPKFALQIIEGKKTIELRRKFPTEKVVGGFALIYASSPLQKIIGYALIENVLFLPVDTIWYQYGQQSKLEKEIFYQYYNNLSHGFAVHLKNPVLLKKYITLKELRDKYAISPPQSYRYLSEKILQTMLDNSSDLT